MLSTSTNHKTFGILLWSYNILNFCRALNCYKCSSVDIPENRDLSFNLQMGLTQAGDFFPKPITRNCFDSLSRKDHVESCDTFCLEALGSVNSENYAGPDLGISDELANGGSFRFTQSNIKSLKHGKITVRACVSSLIFGIDDVLDGVLNKNFNRSDIKETIKQMKNHSVIPNEKFCLKLNASALGVTGKLSVCGCTEDYCNSDEPEAVEPADSDTIKPSGDTEPNESCPDTVNTPHPNSYQCASLEYPVWHCNQSSDCTREGSGYGCCRAVVAHSDNQPNQEQEYFCYDECRQMSYLRNFNFHNCTQLELSNADLQGIFEREILPEIVTGAGIIPPNMGTCLATPIEYRYKCKTFAFLLKTSLDLTSYSGPDILVDAVKDDLLQLSPKWYNFTSIPELGMLDGVWRGCTDYFADSLTSSGRYFMMQNIWNYEIYYLLWSSIKLYGLTEEFGGSDQQPIGEDEIADLRSLIYPEVNELAVKLDLGSQNPFYWGFSEEPFYRTFTKNLRASVKSILACSHKITYDSFNVTNIELCKEKFLEAFISNRLASHKFRRVFSERSAFPKIPGMKACIWAEVTGIFGINLNTKACACNLEYCNSVDSKNGGWSDWRDKPNQASCCDLRGHKTQVRNCDNPQPMGNGKLCLTTSGVEALIEEQTIGCACNGGWTEWAIKNVADKNCWDQMPPAYVIHSRSCSNPVPLNGGDFCLLSDGQSRATIEDKLMPCTACRENEIYMDCGSACPKTCANKDEEVQCTEQCVQGCFCNGNMIKDSNNLCVNPESCPAIKKVTTTTTITKNHVCGQNENCMSIIGPSCECPQEKPDCVVPPNVADLGYCGSKENDNRTGNGSWSSWKDTSPAGQDCCANGGKIKRVRECNNPEPKNEGQACFASDRQSFVTQEELWIQCRC